MKGRRSGNQPSTPLGPIYRYNQKTKMPLCAKKEITASEGYFGLTSTAPHLMPSNRPSPASLPRDLRDDATCTTSRHSFASFEAKLANTSPTCFQAKQDTRSQRVSHNVFILPSILWHNRRTVAHLVLRPKQRNCCGDFVDQITKSQLPVLMPKPRNPSTLVLRLKQETRALCLLLHGADRTQRHPDLSII
jgi:hypothetical protein